MNAKDRYNVTRHLEKHWSNIESQGMTQPQFVEQVNRTLELSKPMTVGEIQTCLTIIDKPWPTTRRPNRVKGVDCTAIIAKQVVQLCSELGVDIDPRVVNISKRRATNHGVEQMDLLD